MTKLQKIFAGFAGCVLLLWFVVFQWRFVQYPSNPAYGPLTCYSPNHEYYVKRYQTLLESIGDPLYAKGMVIVYDKTGKELGKGFSGEGGGISTMMGPIWGGQDVGYFGGPDEWQIELPSSPGYSPYYDGHCFDEVSNVKPLPLEPYPNTERELTVKAVAPLKKTKAPYQLQILVEDKNGLPQPAFDYTIIRAGGARQKGVTDENGRTFVIENTHKEIVYFYHPPLQVEGNFTMPKEVAQCMPIAGAICFSLKDQTANAIKIEPEKQRSDE